MNSPEGAFAQARRHVREGEARSVRQIALIETLLNSGHQQMAETALELLDTFRDVLETWCADLVRIERVRVPPG